MRRGKGEEEESRSEYWGSSGGARGGDGSVAGAVLRRCRVAVPDRVGDDEDGELASCSSASYFGLSVWEKLWGLGLGKKKGRRRQLGWMAKSLLRDRRITD